MNNLVVFDFKTGSDISGWNTVNDVVMGGISSSQFDVNAEGHGEFTGTVSLENNGGFCSLRYTFGRTDMSNYSKFIIRVKGDGKKYQFRVRSNYRDYYAYISYFQTNGEWQTVEIPFDSLYPSFRGRELKMDNYPGKVAEEIGFLIGNKKAENFSLLLDKIELK